MGNNQKTSAVESARISHLRSASPYMAAMLNANEDYASLQESEALWAELDAS